MSTCAYIDVYYGAYGFFLLSDFNLANVIKLYITVVIIINIIILIQLTVSCRFIGLFALRIMLEDKFSLNDN